ncbi:MAG TPA: ion channel [Gemmatimonadaceae bacterium]|nr:ion channel [Gemmatimonadaceae bacterium]
MSQPISSSTNSDDFRDLGFGSVVGGANERRLLNRDGTFNPRREGQSFFVALHPYHFFLTISWRRFFAVVISGYLGANVLFALAYLACGPNAISGADASEFGGRFARAFFFSVETLGTIGYGNIAPVGFVANAIVTAESLTGLLMLALGTGILFARFSRPTAAIAFSDRAIVSPYRNISAFMFRLTNARANQLIELEGKVLYTEMLDGARHYYQLPLERSKVVFFPLSWTIVHPIDESSPLWQLTAGDLAERDAEFLVLMSGIDETFSQTVHARTSYKPQEIVFGERFVNIYNPVRPDGTVSIDIRRLGLTEPAEETEWAATQTFHHTGHFRGYAPPKPKQPKR